MPRLLALLFAVCSLLVLAGHARAQENLRAIIEKAIQVEGGADKLAHVSALEEKIKGVAQNMKDSAFSSTIHYQKPDKFKMDFESSDQSLNATFVMNGDRGWMIMNGQTMDLDAKEIAEVKKSDYVDRVADLVPLLEEKVYTLSALGESTVDGRTAIALKVTSKGQPDVKLYFDKTAGFLIKTEWRDESDAKSMTRAIVLSDYREINPVAAEERILQAAHVAVDGPSLLAYVRRQTLGSADRDHLAQLVRQLGDPSFKVREDASAELVARGAPAVPLLRQALKDSDPEVASRAERCLQMITAGPKNEVPAAVVRLIGLRRPEGSAAVLLAYLASAPDENVAGEVRAALAAVALRDGKPDTVLEQALDDKDPVRREAAAAALGKTKTAAPIHRLLVEGLKRPLKVACYQDDKKTMEYEVVEVNYFTRFEDSVFTRP